jgi:hypothetical protein
MLYWILAAAWRGEIWDRIRMKIETKTRKTLWYFIKPFLGFYMDQSKKITLNGQKSPQ